MKKIFIFIVLAIAVALFFYKIKKVKKHEFIICICKTVEHPALDKTAQGIIDQYKEKGYSEKNTLFIVDSTQGNFTLATQIAEKYKNNNATIVFGIGTLAAQAMQKQLKDSSTPVVFSSVTDPESAGLLSISGVSNRISASYLLEYIKKIQPTVKTLAILYNPGEINSISSIKEIEGYSDKYDLLINKYSLISQSYAAQVANKASKENDALLVYNDNTALSCLATIIKNAETKAVYVSDIDCLPLGCLAAAGPDQYELGKQTARMGIELMNKNNSLSSPKIEFPNNVNYEINQNAAKKYALSIPEENSRREVLKETLS